MNWAGSSATVLNRNVLEDVIPELDENMTTIISMKRENKPTIHDVFGTNPPPASAPIPISVPKSSSGDAVPQGYPSKSVTRDPSTRLRLERPKLLSMSAPPVTKSKFQLSPVSPEPSVSEGGGNSSEPSASIPETMTVVSSIHPSPSSDEVDEIEEDESMSNIQLKKPQSTDNLATKFVKTFGLKDKSQPGDEAAEVHLLSDISTTEDKTSP